MTTWSGWLTDPNDYQSPLPTGSAFWYGTATTSAALDTAQHSYNASLGNGTTDVFYGYIQSYLGSTGGGVASIFTVGIDLSWVQNPDSAFPPVQNSAAIPASLLSQWAGGWRWENTHGMLDATFAIAAGAKPDDLGNPQTAHPDILVWLDDAVTWTTVSPSRMQRAVWDQSSRLTTWSNAAVHQRYPGAPTSISLPIPTSEITARGYRIAVSFAVDLDIPTGTGPAGASYKIQHQGRLAQAAYLNPRFQISLKVLPPLRQYPRDDFLGGAPRQGHVNQPQSIQASTRQGWANAYR